MKRAALAILLILSGCGYDDFSRIDPAVELPAANTTLAGVRTLCLMRALTVSADIVVRGTVTSTDREGNFYRTLCIEDNTGAVELKAGLYDLHAPYPPGAQVALRLKGLVVALEDGVVQAGLPAPSYAASPTAWFSHSAVLQDYLLRSGEVFDITPQTQTIASLQENMCGRLVRVAALIPAAPGLCWVQNDRTTWHRFTDEQQGEIFVQTSPYASFAALSVPSAPVTLTGILSYAAVTGTGGRPVFILRLRTLDDVQ